MNKELLGSKAELLMIASVIGVLLILFSPIPAGLLDLLLIVNFSWALMMLLLTFYIDRPLSFSTFPSLLLISTLFRLALNISATRLILSEAKAGRVIEAMGNYVIHGNYVMGLVVFLILIIVQYIVVTNGAQRVAEVAARFTLDSLPGKQMSIDADLNMGLITQDEAKKRRQALEKETNFYGAMDGASKFVKGDAIAGILIILVDIIGGFAIGLAQKGMSLSQSIQTYTLLTVGDGLVTQIPALIISTATGIIVTRAATDAQLGTEVARQIAAYPKSLVMVSVSLLGMLFLKGIPSLPILLILSIFSFASWFVLKGKKQDKEQESQAETPQEDILLQEMKINPIEIAFSDDLYEQVKKRQQHLIDDIQKVRRNIALELGIIIPAVKLKKDSGLKSGFYQINIHGNGQGLGLLKIEQKLAINNQNSTTKLKGTEVRDPTYGLPAVWINEEQTTKAIDAGFTVIPGLTVLITHLSEIIKNQATELLTRPEAEALLKQAHLVSLSDELIPQLLSLTQVQRILQQLLNERVSIRELDLILEVLLEHAKQTPKINELTEFVRQRLAKTICRQLMHHQTNLSVLTLGSQLEQQINQAKSEDQLFLEPHITEQMLKSLIQQVEHMLKENKRPVLLTSPAIRRNIRQITQRVIPHLSVLSMNEIPMNVNVRAFGVVE